MLKHPRVTPIILVGGQGSRLWPLSRKSYPKQFVKLTNDKTFFQDTLLRVRTSKLINFDPPVIVTHIDFRFIVKQQLQDLSICPGGIILEPDSKNTASAIFAAILFVKQKNPNSTLLILSSDHMMPDIRIFHESILRGIQYTNIGKIVTLGITPTRPETAYGYLELPTKAGFDALEVIRFVEKPDKRLAEEMVAKENYLWNAGIFLFRLDDIVSIFESYAKNIVSFVTKAFEEANLDIDFIKLEKKYWSSAPNISIDYAVMEHLKNLIVIPYHNKWVDLGDWNSVHNESAKDKNRVALTQNAFAINCEETLLRSESKDQIIVGVGLENIIAVAMPDAVLIANKLYSQNIKEVVSNLQKQKIKQATFTKKDYRPWGSFESLAKEDNFQVKRLYVNPLSAISLQSHNFRSEHWIVVKGSAKVTLGEDIKYLKEGESVFIPLGSVHRLENDTKDPLIIIEIQTGTYLEEDDIVRYEDLYSRQ